VVVAYSEPLYLPKKKHGKTGIVCITLRHVRVTTVTVVTRTMCSARIADTHLPVNNIKC
jgi:hypothetical protein